MVRPLNQMVQPVPAPASLSPKSQTPRRAVPQPGSPGSAGPSRASMGSSPKNAFTPPSRGRDSPLPTRRGMPTSAMQSARAFWQAVPVRSGSARTTPSRVTPTRTTRTPPGKGSSITVPLGSSIRASPVRSRSSMDVKLSSPLYTSRPGSAVCPPGKSPSSPPGSAVCPALLLANAKAKPITDDADAAAGEERIEIQETREEEKAAKVADENMKERLAKSAAMVDELDKLVSRVEKRAEERLAAEAAAKKREKEHLLATAVQSRSTLERLSDAEAKTASTLERSADAAAKTAKEEDLLATAVQSRSTVERLADATAKTAKEDRVTSEENTVDEAVKQLSFSTSDRSGIPEVTSSVDTSADVDSLSASQENTKAVIKLEPSGGAQPSEWKWVPVLEVNSVGDMHHDSSVASFDTQVSAKIIRDNIPVASPLLELPIAESEVSESIQWTTSACSRPAPRWLRCFAR